MIEIYLFYLAVVITLSTIISLWERYRPTTKKRYFKRLLRDLEPQIWQREMSRYKLRYVREEVRKDYDTLKNKRDVLEGEIQEWLKQIPALTDEERKVLIDKGDSISEQDKQKLNKDDERRKLEDKRVLLDRDIKRKEDGDERPEQAYVPSLKSCDDGIKAANIAIEELNSLKQITKQYLKKL